MDEDIRKELQGIKTAIQSIKEQMNYGVVVVMDSDFKQALLKIEEHLKEIAELKKY